MKREIRQTKENSQLPKAVACKFINFVTLEQGNIVKPSLYSQELSLQTFLQPIERQHLQMRKKHSNTTTILLKHETSNQEKKNFLFKCIYAYMTPVLPVLRLGSHNAITYCLDMNDRSPVDPMQPDMLQKLDKYMKPLIRPFVYKWAITQVRLPPSTDEESRGSTVIKQNVPCVQEYTIKQQLDCGVRYCDLRIAHRPNDSSTDLYFYHGVYTTLTVEVRHEDINVSKLTIFN